MLPFLQRLKQRKIVQWAVAYFAGAWLTLEVFDMIAEQFLWPAWIRQAATVLVLFGGLITLVLATAHSVLGERNRAKTIADAVRDGFRSGRDRVLPGTLAMVYACLEEHVEAFGLLREARKNEDVELLFLDDPCYDNLHGDPRFVDLVHGMQLPERVYLQPAATPGT